MFSTPVTSRPGSKRPTAQRNYTPRNITPPRFDRPGSSRLATPLHGRASNGFSPRPSFVSEDGDVSMQMEDTPPTTYERFDHVVTGIFARRPELTVSQYTSLPLEIQRTLQSSDWDRDMYTGFVDEATGFAVVVSNDTCFLWNCSTRDAGSATCYIFPNPSVSSTGQTADVLLPCVSLVPFGQGREPGLIVCSITGQIRFWSSVATGLTGAERYQLTQMTLGPTELINRLYRCESLVYIATTTFGRLFRLNVTSASGRPLVTAVPLAKARSVLSRVTSSLFSAGAEPSSGGGAVALAIKPGNIRDGREVWALTERLVQKWKLSADSSDLLILEEDIYSLIRAEISRERNGLESNSAGLDIELLDISVKSLDELAILLSFQTPTVETEARTYAIAQLSVIGNSFKVTKTEALPYRENERFNSAASPRMVLLDRGTVAVVQFKDAISIISIAPDTTFQETLPLKDPWHRILGLGHLSSDDQDQVTLIVITGNSGLLNFHFDLAKIRKSNPDTPTNHLKSTMEQAIFFGTAPENPFRFQFDLLIEGNLGAAAEELSTEILTSKSEYLGPSLDLRVQLADRTARLSHLINFIIENGVLHKLQVPSRQRLSQHAEKLLVASNLWQFHNGRIRDTTGWASHDLLVQAIGNYMRRIGEGQGEDAVRLFFRTKIDNLGVIVEELKLILQETVTNTMDYNDAVSISESNRIMQDISHTILSNRRPSGALYDVDPDAFSIQRWNSEPSQLTSAHFFVDATVKALQTTSNLQNQSEGISELIELLQGQLRDLATVLCFIYQDRATYFQTMGDDRQYTANQELFASARQDLMRHLVRWDGVQHAYRLSEDYLDFRCMTNLCTDSHTASPKKLRRFMMIFGYKFASVLYQWYLENGKLRHLLEQEDQYLPLLDQFFREHNYPRIEWIYDLGVAKPDAASLALQQESAQEAKLTAKHVMLSISKLSALARFEDLDSREAANASKNISHELDWISVHEQLLVELRTAAEPTADSRTSAEVLSEVAAYASASTIRDDRIALWNIFKIFVKRLFQGQALNNEDLVEVLTLKDRNTGDEYATALQIIATTKPLSETRAHTSLRSVWRRLFLADDWTIYRDTSNLNDEQLNDSLRTTLLYHTLHIIKMDIEIGGELILTPIEAQGLPTVAEIATRFPGLTAEQVAGVQESYRLENARLDRLVRESNLLGWYQRVSMIEEADREVFA